MHRIMVLLTLALALCPEASFGASSEPRAFWQKATVQLAAIPPEPEWNNRSLGFQGPGFAPCRVRFFLPQESSLSPVVYLLDRDKPEGFQPEGTHAWVALDTRELGRASAWGDPVRHPMYRITMIAERSLQLLLARTSTTGAGVVGEGAGATAALALGTMVPNQCRFICAYQPRTLPGPACFDPTRFAQGVRTPTLVGLGAHSKAESSEIVMRIYEQLTCDKELAQLPKARRGAGSELKAWQDVWHEWVSDTIDVQ